MNVFNWSAITKAAASLIVITIATTVLIVRLALFEQHCPDQSAQRAERDYHDSQDDRIRMLEHENSILRQLIRDQNVYNVLSEEETRAGAK